MTALTRITFNASKPAADSLKKLEEATGLNRTDVINKSLRVLGVLHDLFGDGPITLQRGDATERLWLL